MIYKLSWRFSKKLSTNYANIFLRIFLDIHRIILNIILMFMNTLKFGQKFRLFPDLLDAKTPHVNTFPT